jgi:hypothetical protein
MAHGCEAAVVTCEDFRLHQRKNGQNVIGEFIEELGVDCDLITRGGAVQDLLRPQPGFENSLLKDLDVSVNLHKVKTIYLIGHEDCGAYKSLAFASREQELAKHYDDLRSSKGMLDALFPAVKTEIRFAELAPGSADRFVICGVPPASDG